VVGNGVLTLARSLEPNHEAPGTGDGAPLDEIVSNLYATRVYVEDQYGARPDRLYLAGFGDESARVASRLASELDVKIEIVTEDHPGLAGYLRSLAPSSKRVQNPSAKVAA
jgi:hypothetical protein